MLLFSQISAIFARQLQTSAYLYSIKYNVWFRNHTSYQNINTQ